MKICDLGVNKINNNDFKSEETLTNNQESSITDDHREMDYCLDKNM